MTSSDVNIEMNSPSLTISLTSDGFSSAESSYSDQSSGNEEFPSSSNQIHGESSDEVDDLFW